MDIGIISGELVKSRLPFPHDLEYEKTYWPFLILTKKDMLVINMNLILININKIVWVLQKKR